MTERGHSLCPSVGKYLVLNQRFINWLGGANFQGRSSCYCRSFKALVHTGNKSLEIIHSERPAFKVND